MLTSKIPRRSFKYKCDCAGSRENSGGGNNENIPFSRPVDLDLLQSNPFKPLALKTQSHVLTLNERPPNFLDLETPPPAPQSQEIHAVDRIKRSTL